MKRPWNVLSVWTEINVVSAFYFKVVISITVKIKIKFILTSIYSNSTKIFFFCFHVRAESRADCILVLSLVWIWEKEVMAQMTTMSVFFLSVYHPIFQTAVKMANSKNMCICVFQMQVGQTDNILHWPKPASVSPCWHATEHPISSLHAPWQRVLQWQVLPAIFDCVLAFCHACQTRSGRLRSARCLVEPERKSPRAMNSFEVVREFNPTP